VQEALLLRLLAQVALPHLLPQLPLQRLGAVEAALEAPQALMLCLLLVVQGEAVQAVPVGRAHLVRLELLVKETRAAQVLSTLAAAAAAQGL